MKKNLPVTGKERHYGAEVSIISVTDLKGIITYVNQDFIDISGFTEGELIGKNHNVVRHPDMPPEAFQDLWDTIKDGHAWRGTVKNRCKNGDHYWVDAYVTPVFENGKIVGYQSVRSRPARDQISKAEGLYRRLNAKEITRIPRRRSVFDISLKVRIFASLGLLSLLAILAGVVNSVGAYQQEAVLGEQIHSIQNLEQQWKQLRQVPESDTQAREQLHAALDRAVGNMVENWGGAQALSRVSAINGWTRNVIVLICVFGLLVMLITGILLVRTAVGPMTQIVDIAQGIAGGDLTRQINVETSDEIGQMLQAMKLMQARLRTLFGRVGESSTALAIASEQVSSASEQTAGGMLRQQAEIDQVATAMNEMTATVQEVAGSTTEAASAAEQADSEADSGQQVVSRTRAAINALAREVETTAGVVHRLEEDSNNISSIMQVIKGIAEQTNLLALNAAIEAARAGESGRGFAVVADEVRTLAQRTQEATKEIRGVIEHLQQGISDAVSVMEKGRKQAEAAVDEASNTERSLESIRGAVATIRDMNLHIASAASQQSEVAEEMNRNVTAISQLAQDTTHHAEEFSASGTELARMANQLQTMVSQFKLGSGSGFNFASAKAAHLAWKARLRAFLDGKDKSLKEQATSGRDCALGKWYYAEGMKRYGEIPEMRSIEEPHNRLHRLIHDIMELKQAGRAQEAEAKYQEVAPLSRQVVDLLDAVERRVRQG